LLFPWLIVATKQVRRITRRKFTPEEKIRIVLEGFRHEVPIRDLCRREGIRPNVYYAWLRDFMGVGKERLARDTVPKIFVKITVFMNQIEI